MDLKNDWFLVLVLQDFAADIGVRTDLLELTKLPYVKGFTARVFWERGLKSIGAVAESDVGDILPLLIKVCVA